MAEIQKTPDGPESSAGDDFHVLWAVHKSLELFNFKTDGLKALTIEGAAPEDAKSLDPDGDLLLGVDVGEYFGGENFANSSRLVFSQLKYSTRHPNMPWTISRICQGKKTGGAGSIIHRLAGIFNSHLEKFGEKLVKEKLSLKLISNRPAAADILELISSVKTFVGKDGKLPALAKLKVGIGDPHTEGIQKIKDASGLPAKDIALFVSLLDFTNCGTGSRSVLKEDAIWAINKVNGVDQVKNYNALHVMVWTKMMPENRANNRLTIIDMLKAFNAGTINQLFPVPARFELRENLVPRLQIGDIKNIVVNAGNLPVCLHAGAGMGKSSVIQQLGGVLPEGSQVILFDCYGGGSYLDPDDARHKPEWALKQIANQMALSVGTDFFLLPAGQPAEIYFREFLERLKAGTAILQQKHPGALLVIVIDAADNSVSAANQKVERSFVPDLSKLSFPEGCRLVVTTRTYRLYSLDLPKHLPVELLPFQQSETDARLQTIFPGLEEDKAVAFHELTFGIPRVQTYALVNSGDGIGPILEPLKPEGKKLDDLIDHNIDFAISKNGSRALVDRVLQYLIALPRPVGTTVLASLAGTSKEVIADLVTDVGQGIIINDLGLTLTDEDFEDYLDRKYPATSQTHQNIADHFLTGAETAAYESRHLGNALRRAGRYESLKEIVLNGKYLSVPQDPVVLKEMVIERTMAAMSLSLGEDNTVDFLKLQVVAAEAAKTNDLLEQTLLANADLTALYGDAQSIEKLISADRLSWYAPVHYRCAAMYARNDHTMPQAREHLKTAQSWIEWRDRLPEHEFRQYSMNTMDFLYAAEAIYRLTDLKSALDFLYRYNYGRIAAATRGFLQHMLSILPEKSINEILQQFKWRVPAQVNITRAYYRTGRKSPIDTNSLAGELARKLQGRQLLSNQGKSAILELSEYFAWQKQDKDQVLILLGGITVPSPGYYPRFYASNFREDKELVKLDRLFKTKALIAALTRSTLTIEAFYTAKIKAVDPSKYAPNDSATEERQRADILFGPLVGLYAARAKFLAGTLDEAGLLKIFNDYPAVQHRNYERYRYNRELPYFQLHYAAIFSDLLYFVNDKAAFCEALSNCFVMKENAIALRLELATTLSRNSTGHTVALRLLKEAASAIFDAETGAGAKIDDYLKCIRIGARLDHSVGEAYFKKMVDTVGEMDIEGFDQVRFIGELARAVKGRYSKVAFDYTHFTEFAYSRLHAWDHFPWRESIAGIGSLDHFGVWAALAKWDHLNLVKADDYLLAATRAALDKDLVRPATLGAFLVISGHYGEDFEQQIVTIIEKSATHGPGVLSAIGHYFYRLIRFECARYRQAELLPCLLTSLSDAGCDDTTLFEQINSAILILSDDERDTHKESDTKHKTARVAITVPTFDWTDTQNLKIELAGLKKNQQWPGNDVVDLILTVRSGCTIGQYLDFLDFLVELNDEHIDYHDQERLLGDTLAIWSDHPKLPEWKAGRFPDYLHRVFPKIIANHDLLNTPSFCRIAKLFDVTENEFARVIKIILATNIERLDASMIYQLGAYTKSKLNEGELIGVIEWVLTRWLSKMPESQRKLQWNEQAMVSDDPQIAAAGFIRYILAHPRKELRWRAVHGLRLAGRMDELSLIPALLGLQDEKNAGPFQHQQYTFYWISAKLWLWIFLKKAAEEQINGIEEFAKDALLALTGTNLPHSLIIYHVQQYCLAISSKFSDIFTEGQLSTVTTALLPPAGQKKVPVNAKSLKSLNELKFRFDTTDTVPYWYQPLCSIFGVPYLTVANRADDIITKTWKYTGNVNEDDHVDTNDAAYRSTSNSHGSIPEVEKLGHYYEFHAMFCVASELILQADAKSDTPDKFKEWLEDWNTTFDGLWLSDLRDTTPGDPAFNESERPTDWQEKISDAYAQNYLQTREGNISVAADIKLTYGSEYESVRISSAMVAKDKGMALLYALQDMPMHRYRLPEENEGDHEIGEDDFNLKGWYCDVGGRDEVHDRLDPLANGLKHYHFSFGDTFMSWGKFQLSDDFRWLGDSKGAIVGLFENWDDSSLHPDSRRIETTGRRLSIDPSTLLTYLGETGYSLIVEVKIDRNEQRKYYRDEEEERLDMELKNIYLIEADGTVKTIGGDFKLREKTG